MPKKKTKDIQAIVNSKVAKELSRIIPNSITYEGELVTCSDNPEKTVIPTGQSLPLSMIKWASIFGVSINTLRQWRKEKPPKYHFRKVDRCHWTLPKNELPAEYLEQYQSPKVKSKLIVKAHQIT